MLACPSPVLAFISASRKIRSPKSVIVQRSAVLYVNCQCSKWPFADFRSLIAEKISRLQLLGPDSVKAEKAGTIGRPFPSN
jgi:hypothetical protein